jgi:hypothetical protein
MDSIVIIAVRSGTGVKCVSVTERYNTPVPNLTAKITI